MSDRYHKVRNKALYAGMAHLILLHIVIMCNVHSCGNSFNSGSGLYACSIDAHYNIGHAIYTILLSASLCS